MNNLKNIKSSLQSLGFDSNDRIELLVNELEMVKLEIEQHIQNMPKTKECRVLKSSAEDAVEKLTEILDLFEDILCSDKTEQVEIFSEIIELIDEINY